MDRQNLDLMKALVAKDLKSFAPTLEKMVDDKIVEKTKEVFYQTLEDSGFRRIESTPVEVIDNDYSDEDL